MNYSKILAKLYAKQLDSVPFKFNIYNNGVKNITPMNIYCQEPSVNQITDLKL